MKRLAFGLCLRGWLVVLLLSGICGCRNAPPLYQRDVPAVNQGRARQREVLEKKMAGPESEAAKAKLGTAFGGSAEAARKKTEAEDRKSDPAEADRLVVYSASVSLVVDKLEAAFTAIRETAETAGGFLQSQEGNTIVIKVPANEFQKVVNRIETIGVVQEKSISGQDVTEEVLDLQTRLKNAEAIRERLANLLDRTKTIEEALRIEQELGRVAETIEVMKGKIHYLEHNAAFSTILVALSVPVVLRVDPNQRPPLRQVPFLWVRALGSEISQGTPERYSTSGKWFFKIRFQLPKGYVRSEEQRNLTRLMSGSAVLVKVARHENLKGGSREFWQSLIHRSLTEQGVIEITDETKLKTTGGDTLEVISGTRRLGGQTFAYRVAVACNRKRVYVYEAWGPEAAFAADAPELQESMQSLKVQ